MAANDDIPDWARESGTADQVATAPTGADTNGGWTIESGTSKAQEGLPEGAHVTTSEQDGGTHCCKKFDFREAIRRDGHLLLITIAIIVVMNIPFVKWVLYPFSIFSTWIHELCHGLAAILIGGRIENLLVFPDTSGLAYVSIPGGTKYKAGFVSTAGYQGTAVAGFLLLLFRRTKRGPRAGIMVLACTMLLSVFIWIRNAFGIAMILIMGIALAAAAWKLPSMLMRSVYVVLCVTVTLNSITNVHDLFGSSHYVNGQPSSTDAHSMSDDIGGPFWLWALLWLLFSLVMATLGLVFAIPGPDEVANFECCGVCVDLGLFNLLNKKKDRSSGADGEGADSEGL